MSSLVEVATTKTTAACDNDKPKKFRWSYEIRDQKSNSKGETVLVYPFLDDKNDEDYLFVASLLVHQPWAARYKKKGSAWKKLHAELSGQQARDGSYPFLKIAESTLHNRFIQYRSLEKDWCDKTGPRIGLEEAEEDDTVYDDNTDTGHRTYSQIIRDGVEAVIEKARAAEETKEKDKEADLQKEWAEQGRCQEIKAAALGRLETTLAGVRLPRDNSGSRPTSPSGCRPGSSSSGDISTTTTGATSRNKTPKGGSSNNKHGIEQLEQITQTLEQRKKAKMEYQMKREERKLAEAANQKLRLENEKLARELEHEEREKQLKVQDQMQKQQMEMMKILFRHMSGGKDDQQLQSHITYYS